MKGSTGGGSFEHSGKEKVKLRSRCTGLVRPASSILSRIFCLLLACDASDTADKWESADKEESALTARTDPTSCALAQLAAVTVRRES
jgi:hypothetical protein